MPNALFTESLWNSLSNFDKRVVEHSDQPFQDTYVDSESRAMADIIQQFSMAHADILDEGEYDLESYFFEYCRDTCELDESAIEVLMTLINAATESIFGEISEDNIRSLLKSLAKPDTSTETTATVTGPTPTGTAAFLRQLKVSKQDRPYGQEDPAKDVKVFDRSKTRYGVPPSHREFLSANTQKWLANPVLNVKTEGCFAAYDSIGQGFNHQFKIRNVLTNEVITPQMMLKTDAEELAATMNQDFLQALHENTMKQEYGLPQTELGESLFRPLSQAKIDAVNAVLGEPQYTMAGNLNQSDYSTQQSPAKAFRETAMLVEARKQKFHEDTDVTESMAIRSKQLRGLHR